MCSPHKVRVLLAFIAVSLKAQQWTEQSVIERFLEQSPLLRESRARMAISAAEYQGRTRYANPSVSISNEGAGRTEFYQASQLLPLSGRLPLLKLAGAASAEAGAADARFNLWQARSALRSAFYQSLSAQLSALLYEKAIARLDQAILKLQVREREGESSRLDRMRAEQERSDLTAQLSTARAAYALKRGELLAFLPTGTLIESLEGQLETDPKLSPVQELIQLAINSRPDLAAERKRMEQFRLEQRAAERLRLPEPTIIAGLKRAETNSSRLATGPVIGVSLSIPFMNQGKAEVSRYSAEQERTAARLEILTRLLSAAIEAAALNYEIRKQAITAYDNSFNSNGKHLLDIASVAYEEGEVGILQLLDAYRVLHKSSLRQVELRTEARLAQIHLESLLGQELPK